MNVNGTKNIISLCFRYKVKRLLYVSSVHAIPEQNKLKVLQETTDFSPDLVEGAYAKTKAEATKAVLDAVREGLDAVVVHPSGILGPFDTSGNHLVQMVTDYIEGRLPVLPMWMAKMAAPLIGAVCRIQKRRPLYTRYSLYTLQSNDRFDHTKATSELGFKPRDLFQTITDTVTWLKKKGHSVLI